MLTVLHLLRGLEIGGMERATIRLATRGIQEGIAQSLLTFDEPFRSELLDFSPGTLVIDHISRRPGVDLRFSLKLAQKFRQNYVSVVHAHNDTALFYAALALLMGRLTKTALIGTFRTWPSHNTRGARLLTRWAAARADQITAVSQELSDKLIRSGWVKKCHTIWNGTDLTEFSPHGAVDNWREIRGIPRDAIVVGHVGRFAPIKRHHDLFESAEALRSAQPPIYFACAGNGPLFETFRKRAEQLPTMILLSNVRDVASFLRSIDIFVLCSSHEGAPQALLEAMACARPIIATRVGGVPYMLNADSPSAAGRLISPLRPDLLSQQVLELARDGKLRNHLGRLASQRVQRFSFEQEWSQYAALYTNASISR
jgi:L-malate glycosyltransferase